MSRSKRLVTLLPAPVLRALRLADYERRYRRLLRSMRRARGEPIVVYTIGKTGSSTIIATLEHAVPGRPTYQVHNLAPHRMLRSEQHYRSLPHPIVTRHVVAADFLTTHRPPSPARPWDVITLVRDPVAQDVSAFFQVGMRRGLFELGEDGSLRSPATIEELRERFLGYRDHEDDVRFFDEELQPVLGVDVYAEPFDPDAGFVVVGSDRARVLVLRNEDVGRVGPIALGRFLGIEPPELVAANVGEEKRYARVYRQFRELALPADLVDSLYDSELARHFYSEEELARFRAEWTDADR